MRLFTALALSNEQKRDIFEWKERHFSRLPKAISPDNYHITLAFFGEIANQALEPLVDRLDQAHQRNSPRSFDLTLNQTAFWPKTGIVWIGPREWPEHLGKLAKSHAHAGASQGAKKSRFPYQPHISLARGVKEFSGEVVHPSLNLRIENISLFQSLKGSSGRMQYQTVYQWQLNQFGIHDAR